MKLSIVTTLYHSAPYLEEFYERVCRAAEQLTSDYELVFVNDGSPDESLEIARSFLAGPVNATVIDLSRNYGHHKSIMTGLSHTKGDLVFLIDCDLEEEPELLLPFHTKMQESKADLVYGTLRQRKGGWFERLSGDLFYRLYNRLSEFKVPPNSTLTRLMSRRYVDALTEHRDVEIFLAGLCVMTGFLQVSVPVTKKDKGSSTYSLALKITSFTNALTSFSSRPLVYIFYLGIGIFFASGMIGLYLVVRKVFFGQLLSGWVSLMISIWMIGGLMLFCQGVIGVYLSRVFMETKRRPYTVIRAVYEKTAAQGQAP